MLKCEDIDKKNNKKCSSDAKWMVKINNETDYTKPRCGRHCRKLEKIPIDKDFNKSKEKKGLILI
jgi:hypothetical protein